MIAIIKRSEQFLQRQGASSMVKCIEFVDAAVKGNSISLTQTTE